MTLEEELAQERAAREKLEREALESFEELNEFSLVLRAIIEALGLTSGIDTTEDRRKILDAVKARSGRCATCKHWAAFTPPCKPKYRGDYEPPESAEVANRLGVCGRVPSLQRFEGDERTDFKARPTIAAVEDLSDHCFLRTAATFGCVLYERTDPAG